MVYISAKAITHNCIAAFAIGGAGYSLVELLWRGRTHWTMTITGGICVLSIHLFNLKYNKQKFFIKCVVSSIIITFIEFLVGCVVNLTFKLNVWDYSNLAFNILGQICLLYSVFWFFLSIPLMFISEFLKAPKRARPFIGWRTSGVKKSSVKL